MCVYMCRTGVVAECRGSCFNCAFIDRCGVTRREGLFVSVCVCVGGIYHPGQTLVSAA